MPERRKSGRHLLTWVSVAVVLVVGLPVVGSVMGSVCRSVMGCGMVVERAR